MITAQLIREGGEHRTAGVVLADGPQAVAADWQAVAEWKLLMSAALVGLTESALGLAVEFAKTRETLGVPIAALQGISFPLAESPSGSRARGT